MVDQAHLVETAMEKENLYDYLCKSRHCAQDQ